MAISDKLQSILDSKTAIKAAIEAKGVADVGDVLSAYAGKIASIPSGGSGFTGHADVEGLKAIGWTDEDIEYYQKHGVNWNEEDDEYHKVPQDNIDLYGVLTIDNIQKYNDRIVYLPKIDTSGVTDMDGKFYDCKSLVAIPLIDTASVKIMKRMFYSCYSLNSIPLIDTSNVTDMSSMFYSCCGLIDLPQLSTTKVTTFRNFVTGCYSINSVKIIDVSSATDITYMFNYCYSIQDASIKGLKQSIIIVGTNILSKESLLYIIENAAPTEPITIILSAYCYGKYNADPDVVAALEKQPNISLASA